MTITGNLVGIDLGTTFSAIAAAGPIAGPILACQSFGWLPCLLWISLGVVLIGTLYPLIVDAFGLG